MERVQRAELRSSPKANQNAAQYACQIDEAENFSECESKALAFLKNDENYEKSGSLSKKLESVKFKCELSLAYKSESSASLPSRTPKGVLGSPTLAKLLTPNS